MRLSEIGVADYERMDVRARTDLAARIASSIDGRWTSRFVGRLGVPEVKRGGVLYAFVPGGRFTMGFAADEMRALLRESDVAPGSTGSDYWRPIYETAYEQARPTRTVYVPAFLCARAPLLDNQVRPVDPALIGVEPFPEMREVTDAGPTFVPAEAAVRLLAHFGARTLSETEWEYVAREGRSQAGSDYEGWHAGVEELYRRPAFGPCARTDTDVDASDEDHASSPEELLSETEDEDPFGVWGLALGEWVADAWHPTYRGAPSSAGAWDAPRVPVMTRGGAVLCYPWNDSAEVLFAHPAYRSEGASYGDLAVVRPALDLP